MKPSALLALLALTALFGCAGRGYHYEENLARVRASPEVRLTSADKAAIIRLVSRATPQYAYGIVTIDGELWVLTAEPNETAPRNFAAFRVAQVNAKWRILSRRRMPRSEMIGRLDYPPRN